MVSTLSASAYARHVDEAITCQVDFDPALGLWLSSPGNTGRANLGADWRLTGVPVSLGANASFTDGGAARRQLDAYVSWKVDDSVYVNANGQRRQG